LRQRQWTAEAFAASQAGLLYCGEDDELLLLQGLVLLDRGDHAGAERSFVRVLEKQAVVPDLSDLGRERRAVARHHLALSHRARQRDDEAVAIWSTLVAEQPNFRPGWKELGEIFLAQGRWAELDRAVQQLENLPGPLQEAHMLRVRGLLAQREFATVRALLDRFIAQAPQAVWPRLALSYAYLQEGRDWPAAEQALRAVLELDPEHAEARHNLALLLKQQERVVA
jgi:tetratricopeptide (TPR) repeat protein